MRFASCLCGSGFAFSRFGFAGGEFEADFSLFVVVDEEGGEGAILFGNEFVKEIGLAGLEEFYDLGGFDLALENDFLVVALGRLGDASAKK